MPKTNANTEEYSSTIVESLKELTGKEKVRFKDLTASRKIDELVTDTESLKVALDNYIILSVHNPKAEQIDYNVIIIVDKDGNSYYTSSNTFERALKDVVEAMKDETEEWGIEVVKKPSSNYKGKFFLTCTVY